MFKPQLGCICNKLSIDRHRASTDAQYFLDIVSTANRQRPYDYAFVNYSSSVVIWCRDDPSCDELTSRFVRSGVPFSYSCPVFEQKHLDRIEQEDN